MSEYPGISLPSSFPSDSPILTSATQHIATVLILFLTLTWAWNSFRFSTYKCNTVIQVFTTHASHFCNNQSTQGLYKGGLGVSLHPHPPNGFCIIPPLGLNPSNVNAIARPLGLLSSFVCQFHISQSPRAQSFYNKTIKITTLKFKAQLFHRNSHMTKSSNGHIFFFNNSKIPVKLRF